MDTYAFVGVFVDDLARGGLRHVCICPGSRSTPLAIAFALHPGIRVWMHLDERSAAFFALGLAKATGVPAAMVCTSGTAAANFMPALVEAQHARVPLLALTADRPPELRGCGAPQAIDQIRFYGAQVKWAVEMPLPEASETMIRHARTMAARALATAAEIPAGPVHLNFPFREPLVPPAGLPPAPTAAPQGREQDRPYAHVVQSTGGAPSTAEIERYAADLAATPRGLIICGPEADRLISSDAVLALGRALGYPILADPLSGLRCGPFDHTSLICAYDAFLRDERFAVHAVPQVVLRFGAMPTSKPVLQYLQRHREARLLLIDPAGWRDPTLLAAEVLRLDPDHFCRALAAAVPPHPSPTDRSRPSLPSDRSRRPVPPPSGWLDLWREAERRTGAILDRELAAIDELFEGRAMVELADLLPAGATLVAGNSMPVRDIDTFFRGSERAIRILGNRGASGIDGVVSTALGIAAAGQGPTVLAIGDISLYHDANGLLAARQHRLDLTIVLLNNDGGGIFSFLPQASLSAHHGDTLAAETRRRGDDTEREGDGRPQSPARVAPVGATRNPGEDLFETLFGTPHGLDFAHLAALYGARYTLISDWSQFRDAVRAGMVEGGLHLVEVPTERERNVTLHRRLWPAVGEALRELSYPPEKEEMP